MPDSRNKKRILICPLDWGFGHATRCIPIIRELIQQNAEVIIAAPPALKAIFQKEFPQLTRIDAPAYAVKYSRFFSLPFMLFLQLPRLLYTVKKENKWLKAVIEKHNVNIVISDNRYGLYSKKIPCVFITHQLFIPAPFFANTINRINHAYINKFICCWVPDAEGPNNLSGHLSHGEHQLKHIHYTGPLSRFKTTAKNTTEFSYNCCILLSGPEPQRTVLEELLIKQLNTTNKKIVFIRGTLKAPALAVNNKSVEVHDFLNGTALQDCIEKSEYVICRSGYSSIMDLEALQKKAILIPTPGQAEQEYLAQHLSEKFNCAVIQQNEWQQYDLFDEEQLKKIQPIHIPENHHYLSNAITQLLKN